MISRFPDYDLSFVYLWQNTDRMLFAISIMRMTFYHFCFMTNESHKIPGKNRLKYNYYGNFMVLNFR